MPTYEYEITTKQKIHVDGEDKLDADRLMVLYMVNQNDDRVVLISERPSLPVFIGEVTEVGKA